MKNNYKVLIIGAGVSGMIAAISAKERDIAVLEASPRAGKKLLATGNGRCNLLNKAFEAKFYNCPDFVAPIINKHGLTSLEAFYNNLGLLLRYDAEGRGYPLSESAASVLDVLRGAISKKGIEIICDASAEKIEKTQNGFTVKTVKGSITCEKLLFASGSDAGFGFDSLTTLSGLARTTEFTPSLVPLCTDLAPIKGLNGVRVKCKASLLLDDKTAAEEDGEVLFKSFGLSGIAIFNLSGAYARARDYQKAEISLNLLDCTLPRAEKLFCERLNGQTAAEFLTGVFHKMLATGVINKAGLTVDTLMDKSLAKKLAAISVDYRLTVLKTADKSLAQVSSGGVKLSQINKNTLESLEVKNLYFAGEALDVDGLCGGYNLMWAAASALTVAESI